MYSPASKNEVLVLGNEGADFDSAVSAWALANMLDRHSKATCRGAIQRTSERSNDRSADWYAEREGVLHVFHRVLEQAGAGAEFSAALPVAATAFEHGSTRRALRAIEKAASMTLSIRCDKQFKSWPGSRVVLVDHNDHSNAPVLGCFDHHQGEVHQVTENSYVRTPRASTCSLIGSLWLALADSEQNRFIGSMLACGIYLDSYGFAPEQKDVRWHDLDREIWGLLTEGLCASLDFGPRVSEARREYQKQVADGSIPLSHALLDDIKFFRYDSVIIPFASLSTDVRAKLVETPPGQLDQELSVITEVFRSEGCEQMFFMTISQIGGTRQLNLLAMSSDAKAQELLSYVADNLGQLILKARRLSTLSLDKWSAACLEVRRTTSLTLSLQVDITYTRKVVEPILRKLFSQKKTFQKLNQ